MAAMFFQGTLGTFMAYSQIGGGASASPSADGRPPGMSAPPPAMDQGSASVGGGARASQMSGYAVGGAGSSSPAQTAGKFGNAEVK